MAGPLPPADVDAIRLQVETAPGLERLRGLLGDGVDVGAETMGAILEEAARFADA